MASKRKLKKEIEAITNELFTECLFYKLYIPEMNDEKVVNLMSKIIQMEKEFMRRANNVDGKQNSAVVKNYYSKLKSDLVNKVNEIMSDMELLGQSPEFSNVNA